MAKVAGISRGTILVRIIDPKEGDAEFVRNLLAKYRKTADVKKRLRPNMVLVKDGKG